MRNDKFIARNLHRCFAATLAVTLFSWAGSAQAAESPQLKLDTSPIESIGDFPSSYAPVVKQVSPSVVNISTTRQSRDPFGGENPLLQDPFLRRFFGDRLPQPDQRNRFQESRGSGVVVSEDGYILTNNHVVQGADEVKVSLPGTRREYDAEIIGTDPQTDVAVLKIEASDLTAITITDSDLLEVGDVVLAVGNPFDIGQTVTMGIVSAKGRGGFGLVDYEDFIQTDASINPGNSGGALVDVQGRLVGINTFIISRTGGNQGVGFAVPINMARLVMERLVTEGKVVRGYLGVFIQAVTPDLAEAFNLPGTDGALVGGVAEGSPAAKAEIKEGDVIVELDGQPVRDSRQLQLRVSQTSPGSRVTVTIIRGGERKQLELQLGELPSNMTASGRSTGPAADGTLDGLELSDLNPAVRERFGIPDDVKGALVTAVAPGSAAAEAGLQPGTVIQDINQQPVNSLSDARRIIGQSQTKKFLLRVWFNGGSRYLVLNQEQE